MLRKFLSYIVCEQLKLNDPEIIKPINKKTISEYSIIILVIYILTVLVIISLPFVNKTNLIPILIVSLGLSVSQLLSVVDILVEYQNITCKLLRKINNNLQLVLLLPLFQGFILLGLFFGLIFVFTVFKRLANIISARINQIINN